MVVGVGGGGGWGTMIKRAIAPHVQHCAGWKKKVDGNTVMCKCEEV